MKRRRFGGALVGLGLVSACSSAPPRTPGEAPAANRGAVPASSAAADASVSATIAPPLFPSLEALAARAPLVAPGLQEIARVELGTSSTALARSVVTADRDLCVRVALVADTEAHAWLDDGRSSEPLAAATDTRDGALASDGPVCVRRGTDVVLHVESRAPGHARFVAWASAPR